MSSAVKTYVNGDTFENMIMRPNSKHPVNWYRPMPMETRTLSRSSIVRGTALAGGEPVECLYSGERETTKNSRCACTII